MFRDGVEITADVTTSDDMRFSVGAVHGGGATIILGQNGEGGEFLASDLNLYELETISNVLNEALEYAKTNE